MGQLTDQVINDWSKIPAPQTPSWASQFEPDVKTSWGKSAIKSEILTPSHAVSISPSSFKVEVDPLVYLDQWATIRVFAHKLYSGLLQSVDIKATGKLAFKGDKEVAFKSKSNVEYSSNDDDEAKTKSKVFVAITIAASVIVAIAGEILASQKSKTKHKILWWSHAGFSRILFWIFSIIQREKIKIELAGIVPAAAARADAARADEIELTVIVPGAASQVPAAARADAAAQADANEIDAVTRTFTKSNAALQSTPIEFDKRLNSSNAQVHQARLNIAKEHQQYFFQLRKKGIDAATQTTNKKPNSQ